MLEKTVNLKSSLINVCFLSTSALTFSLLLPGLPLVSPAIAVQVSNGQTAFNNPPSLIRSATSFNGSYISGTYQFTISVPKDAGEPLEAITISQQPNVEKIAFDVSQSHAFQGNSFAGGPALKLASIGGNQTSASDQQTVVFDPPIAPGSTVTIEILAKSNPQGGVYLFGITAYPAGTNGIGQFLGYGRLNFY